MASNQAWFQQNLTVSSHGQLKTWSVGKHRLSSGWASVKNSNKLVTLKPVNTV